MLSVIYTACQVLTCSIMCLLYCVPMVSLCSCMSLTLSGNGWPLLLFVLHSVTMVGLCSLVSLTITK